MTKVTVRKRGRTPKAAAQTVRVERDEEATAFALERFSQWPFKSIKELAGKGRDPSIVSRAIARAFREHLVQLIATSGTLEPRRKKDIEEQLKHRFLELSTCTVIEYQDTVGLDSDGRMTVGRGTGGGLDSNQKNEREDRQREEDDKLHETLGRAMAAHLSKDTMFRSGDVIGLGSGRGVYYTIQGLAGYPKLRAQVTLVSLTGDLYPRDHSKQVNVLLDADTHLALLGPRFQRSVEFDAISLPIVCPDSKEIKDPKKLKEELKKMLANSPIGEERWKNRPATLALVGVGVLSVGHRLYEEVEPTKGQPTRILEDIYGPLKDLVGESKMVEEKFGYCPVGDISNRLFYVKPRSGIVISEEGTILKLINKINAHLFTVREEQLAQTDIILVAGSKKKAPAIRQLLMEKKYRIRHLCVDQPTAEEILDQNA